jgi:hypothetical protein
MKKLLFLLAVGCMIGFASCNQKPAEDQNVVEDTAVVEEVVPQDTVKQTPPQTPPKEEKKVEKKEEPKKK